MEAFTGLVYSRISQAFGEADDSLDNQVSRSTAIAETLAVPIAYVFRERDSGHETVDTRKELLKARELVRARRVSHFFIHNFDRLSRTPEELVSLWKECQKHGVTVVVAMWPQFCDLDIDLAKMMLRMVGMVGEMEWTFIRNRTTQNKARIREKGQVVGEGGPRFGYTWDKETRSRKPSEEVHPTFGVSSAHVVRTIFDLIGNQDYSLRRCARELNERGWPTPAVFRGKKYKDGRNPRWTNDSVRLVVVDEQYKGIVTCSRTEQVGKRKTKKKPRAEWQVLNDARTVPVVDADLWDKANRRIRDNDIIGQRTAAKRSAAETRNESNFALFRGLISCGLCGSPLRPVWSQTWNPVAKDHSGAKQRIYRCDSRVDNFERGLNDACRGKAVYERKVKDAVWAQVMKVVTDEGLIRAEAQRLKNERPGEELHRSSHTAALAEVKTCARRIDNLISSLGETDDAEDRAMIRAAIEQQKTARDEHQRRADRLAAQLTAYDEISRRADEVVERCQQLRANNPQLLAMPDDEKRHWLEWLGVSLVGNGKDLTLRLDMGLSQAIETPSETPSPLEHQRSTSRNSSQNTQLSLPPQRVHLEYCVPCN